MKTIVFSLICMLCVNVGTPQSPVRPINIVIILDTSDRISDEKHPGQLERDKEIIGEIVTAFEKVTKQHILASDTLQYHDRLKIAIPNQPSVPPVPRQVIRNLTIADTNEEDHRSLAGINADVEKQKQVFLDTLDSLYEFVRQHKHTGSDIWEWFKYEAENYFSESHQNIVICISDGYLNFDNIIEDMRIPRTYMQVKKLRDDPQWQQKIHSGEGLLPTGTDLSRYNIDFLMSEIQLQTDENNVPYQKDFQIITRYWEVWLKEMKIKSTNFGKVGHPIGQKIRNLIEQR